MEHSQETKDKYNRIVDVFREKLNLKGITILTGNNGSGKSLIRKQVVFRVKDEIFGGDASKMKSQVISTSMEARTSSNAEWGALSSIMQDDTWIATSINTFSNIKGAFLHVKDGVQYLIIDEFEIGCGEETTLALVHYINENLKELISSGKLGGAMIITHSRIGVEKLNSDYFLNIEGKTKDEWLNREIVPTDLDELEKNELFYYIRDIQNEKK